MPEHLRALLVVLVFAAAVFHFARPATLQLVSAETFSRWRIAWFGLTLALFLSHSFWVYAIFLILWTRYSAARDSNTVGLFFLLLFVAPPSAVELPGFGLVDHLLVLTHYRLLIIALFLPIGVRLMQARSTPRWGSMGPDWPLIAYFTLITVMELRDANVTSFARQIVSNVIDILLPYYVISRSIRDIEALKVALTGYVIASMLLAALTIFEVLRYWKLYGGVLYALGLDPWAFGGYLQRGGLLRPNVSLGNSIVLGYVIMVGFAFFLGVQTQVKNQWRVWSVGGLLLLGVVGAISRGPWVGLAVVYLVFLLTGDQKFKRLFQFSATLGLILLVASQFTIGRLLFDMLPFFGEVDAGNVQYRADLLTQSMPVIQRNLFFGSVDYLSAPELQIMRQGEGIIDIVNTYLLVLLDNGLIGLLLFVLVFFQSASGIFRGLRKARMERSVHALFLGRSLLAALLGVMVVIYTVSGISAVPIVYWTLVGVCAAYEQAVFRKSQILNESG